MPDDDLPGGAIAKRDLHFIYLIDCSASMHGAKMQSLNHAIRESIPHMRSAAKTNVNAEIVVRSIRFASGASWHQSTPTPVEKYDWKDLNADNGSTDMAGALALAKEALQKLPEGRQFPPVLCLISDGIPDSESEYRRRLAELKDSPWGARAIRIAIGIGAEASNPPGLTVLQEFMGNIELPVLTADHAQDLVKMIRFVSTEVAKSASSPPSVTNKSAPGDAPSNAVIPPPPPTNTKKPANDPNLPW
jgi:uncharacterized protein YegL